MHRLILLPLALVACATEEDLAAFEAPGVELAESDELAFAMPGLDLTVSQLLPGDNARFTVTGLQPGQDAHVFYSTTGTGPGPCLQTGPCLDLLGPPNHASVATANADGWASAVVRVPANVRIGTRVWLQAGVYMGPGGARSITSDVEATVVDGLMCPLNYDPVCGINGVTYGNSCEAGVAGWPVDYLGPC